MENILKKKAHLEGVTLKAILEDLVAAYGWHDLGGKLLVNCFNTNPSMQSSLKFFRKTPWARQKLEALYNKLLAERSKQIAVDSPKTVSLQEASPAKLNSNEEKPS